MVRGLSKWVSESRERSAAGRLGMIRAAGATQSTHSRTASLGHVGRLHSATATVSGEYACHRDLRRRMQIIHKCVWRWERGPTGVELMTERVWGRVLEFPRREKRDRATLYSATRSVRVYVCVSIKLYDQSAIISALYFVAHLILLFIRLIRNMRENYCDFLRFMNFVAI